jgi:hypothetical protein
MDLYIGFTRRIDEKSTTKNYGGALVDENIDC